MAREVIIHTWCDIEFNPDGGDLSERVDAETITWYLHGERMEIDLCKDHQQETTLAGMDDLVRIYGRAWEDPDAPLKKKAKTKRNYPSKTEHPEAHYLVDAHYTKDGTFVCDVKGCAAEGREWETIQSLRMHQLRSHDIRIPDEHKAESTRKKLQKSSTNADKEQ